MSLQLTGDAGPTSPMTDMGVGGTFGSTGGGGYQQRFGTDASAVPSALPSQLLRESREGGVAQSVPHWTPRRPVPFSNETQGGRPLSQRHVRSAASTTHGRIAKLTYEADGKVRAEAKPKARKTLSSAGTTRTRISPSQQFGGTANTCTTSNSTTALMMGSAPSTLRTTSSSTTQQRRVLPTEMIDVADIPKEVHHGLLASVLKEMVSTARSEANDFLSMNLLAQSTYQRLVHITSHLPNPNALRVAGAFHILDMLTLIHAKEAPLFEQLKSDIMIGIFSGMDPVEPLQHFRRMCEGERVSKDEMSPYRPPFFDLLAQQKEKHAAFVSVVQEKATSTWKQQALLQRVIARWQGMLVDRLFCAWRNYGPRRDRRIELMSVVIRRKSQRLTIRRFFGYWKNETKRTVFGQLSSRLGRMKTRQEAEDRNHSEQINSLHQELEKVSNKNLTLGDEIRTLREELLQTRTKVDSLEVSLEEERIDKIRWKNLACGIVNNMIPLSATDPEQVLFGVHHTSTNERLFAENSVREHHSSLLDTIASRSLTPTPEHVPLGFTQLKNSPSSNALVLDSRDAPTDVLGKVQQQQQPTAGGAPSPNKDKEGKGAKAGTGAGKGAPGSTLPDPAEGVSKALLKWDPVAVVEASGEKLLLAWANGVAHGRVVFEDAPLLSCDRSSDTGSSRNLSSYFSRPSFGDDYFHLHSEPTTPQEERGGRRDSQQNDTGGTSVLRQRVGEKQHYALPLSLAQFDRIPEDDDDSELPVFRSERLRLATSSTTGGGGVAPAVTQLITKNFDEDLKSGEVVITVVQNLARGKGYTAAVPRADHVVPAGIMSPKFAPPAPMSAANWSESALPSMLPAPTPMKTKHGRPYYSATTIDQYLSGAKVAMGYDFPVAGIDFTTGNPTTSYLFLTALLEHTHRVVLDPETHTPPAQVHVGVDTFPDTEPSDCRETYVAILQQQAKWTALINRTRGHAFALLANRVKVVDEEAVVEVLHSSLIQKVLSEHHEEFYRTIRNLQDLEDDMAQWAAEIRRVFACYSTKETEEMTHAKYLRFLGDTKLISKTFTKKNASSFFDYLLTLETTLEHVASSASVKTAPPPSADHSITTPVAQETLSFSVEGMDSPVAGKSNIGVGTGTPPQQVLAGGGEGDGGGDSSAAKPSGKGSQAKLKDTPPLGGKSLRAPSRSIRGLASSGDDFSSPQGGFDEEDDTFKKNATALQVHHLTLVVMHIALCHDGSQIVSSPQPTRTFSKSFTSVMEQVVKYAGSSGVDEFKERVYRKDVQEVFSSFEKGLKKVYVLFGGADGDPDLSFEEFLTLLKECRLFDSHFTVEDAKKLFGFLMDGDLEAEMVYREFLEALVALCDFRVPSPWIPLSERLKSFLQTMIFPPLMSKYKAFKALKKLGGK